MLLSELIIEHYLVKLDAIMADEDTSKKDDAAESEEKSEEEKAKEALQLDHETELKRERERREVAEKAAADLAFKLREKKRKGEDEEEEDEDRPLTAKDLEGIMEKNRQRTWKELQAEMITEKAKKLASSDSEANLIVEIHKNRVWPEGLTLGEQIEEAYAIANRKKLLAQNEELKRSLKSKEIASDFAGGTHRDSSPLSEPKLSSPDVQALKAAGFGWDGKVGAWKRETKDRILFKSRDLKKTWTQPK